MSEIWVRGESGLLLAFSEPVHESITHRLGTGELTRVTEDGDPWVAGDAEPEPDDEVPPDAPPLPKRADNRATWTEFAISQGMGRAEAAAKTKAELVDEFTKDRSGG